MIQRLLQYKNGKVTVNDIGVIAPYRKQVCVVRKPLLQMLW
jgi:superfamily I DNA and/or RNA helicase